LVSTDEESAIGQPGVASVVVADMWLFLVDLGVGSLQGVVLDDSVELVSVVTCYQDGVWLSVVEGTLIDAHLSTNTDRLEGEALCLIPGP
jgi:hypothetical protein